MTISHVLDLDPKFETKNGAYLTADIFKFSGGEVHVKLKTHPGLVTSVQITHRLNSSDNIFELLLATDAVRREYRQIPVSVFIPYIPYARQDKRMVNGEPFSLKVFADIINTQNYDEVMVFDPHSDVSGAVINNLSVLSPYFLLKSVRENLNRGVTTENLDNWVVISPDGGALKRIYSQAKLLGYGGPIYCATKVRDVSNGKIIRTTVDASPEELNGQTCIIIDDICDGGRTFIELAKVLKEKGAARIVLVVSHGIFSAGEEPFKGYIDKIFTTNSIKDDQSDLITRIPL